MAKQVVIHEDDIGLSHGANTAFLELSSAGSCTAGSVMVACPWFPEAAAIAREHPEFDIGVHLTLNSDMCPYKWRPLTGGSGGLVDESGFMWADVKDVRKHATVAAVERELRAQVETALAAGIDVTHLDCHMGAAMMPEFVEVYDRLPACKAERQGREAGGEEVAVERAPGQCRRAAAVAAPEHGTDVSGSDRQALREPAIRGRSWHCCRRASITR